MNTFQTSTTVRDSEAEQVLRDLLAHIGEHNIIATRQDNTWILDYRGARIAFSTGPSVLHAQVTAPTREALYEARMLAYYHIIEFSHCAPDAIQWQGDDVQLSRPPAFRLITAESVQDLSPHMRRIRFCGEDLERYAPDDNIHCKLIFPQPGDTAPVWPTLAPDGTPQFPKGDKRLNIRTYTLRRIDAAAGWFDVDFVLHEDAGPGSAWAAQATPGQQIGLSGPGGSTARHAGWMLLAGDETALPAIARIGEALPADTRGVVLVEVQDAAEQILLRLPPNMSLQWLHRGAAAPGTTTLLADAIQASSIEPGADRYVWVAAEFTTAQTIRGWLRNTLGMGVKEQLVVAYWRRGLDETQMKGRPAGQADASARNGTRS